MTGLSWTVRWCPWCLRPPGPVECFHRKSVWGRKPSSIAIGLSNRVTAVSSPPQAHLTVWFCRGTIISMLCFIPEAVKKADAELQKAVNLFNFSLCIEVFLRVFWTKSDLFFIHYLFTKGFCIYASLNCLHWPLRWDRGVGFVSSERSASRAWYCATCLN